MSEINDFLYPHSKYNGNFTPKTILFNAKLQEFAQRVSYICNLQTSGKISSDKAWEQIEALWEKLDFSANEMGIN
ncbi:hypothetical protein BCD67_14275 [Oscillatoriales cyanobacterium USR001]|nr:hypothetical protein BCD67_14275 [Oscillatoriales cyanobacterium USR001]